MFVCVYEFSELRAVVSEVVYSDGVISAEFKNTVKRAAYDGGRKVSYMKWLCDIDRRIVYANRLALALVRRAEFFALRSNSVDSLFYETEPVHLEVEIAVHGGNLAYDVVGYELIFEFFGNHNGGFTHYLGKLEARQSVVAHFLVGRNDYIRGYFLNRQIQIAEFFGYIFSVIHSLPFFFS